MSGLVQFLFSFTQDQSREGADYQASLSTFVVSPEAGKRTDEECELEPEREPDEDDAVAMRAQAAAGTDYISFDEFRDRCNDQLIQYIYPRYVAHAHRLHQEKEQEQEPQHLDQLEQPEQLEQLDGNNTTKQQRQQQLQPQPQQSSKSANQDEAGDNHEPESQPRFDKSTWLTSTTPKQPQTRSPTRNDNDNDNDNDNTTASNDEDANTYSSTKVTAKTKRECEIPFVQNAMHIATTISEVDLYTKRVSIKLARIEHVTPRRITKRMVGCMIAPTASPTETRPPPSSPHTTWLQRFYGPNANWSFGSIQDDGPLRTAYKHVLSLQLLQLDQSLVPVLLQKNQQLFPSAQLHRRMTIFFYNNFAKAVGAFFNDYRGDDYEYCLSIHNAPAACIFPYICNHHASSSSSSWALPDTSPYVLCIGDMSKIQVANKPKMVFATSDLKITLLAKKVQTQQNQETESVAECIVDATTIPKYQLQTNASNNGTTTTLHQTLKHYEATSVIAATSRGLFLTGPSETSAGAAAPPPTAESPAAELSTEITSRDPPATTKRRDPEWKLTATAPPAPHKAKRSKHGLFKATTKATDTVVVGDQVFDALHAVRRIYETHDSSRKKYPSANVCGVVASFSQPTRTKSNSWFLLVSLVDPSLDNTSSNDDADDTQELTISFFRKTVQELPQLRTAGDLMVVREAGIQEYQGNIQLLARSTSNFCVIPSCSFEPAAAAAANPMKDFWSWGQERLAIRPTIKHATRFSLANTASLEEAGDTTVMICSLYEPKPRIPARPVGYLRVWDGTGTPVSDPPVDGTPEALATIKNGDPPREAIISLHETVQRLNSSRHRTASTIVLQDIISVCGRVVNVAVWEEPHWEFCKEALSIGTFVRLRNVSATTITASGDTMSSSHLLSVMAKTRIVPIPNETLEVRHLLVDHQRRLERKDPTNPQSGLLPLGLSTVAVTEEKHESRASDTHPSQLPAVNFAASDSIASRREQEKASSPPPTPSLQSLEACSKSVKGGMYNDCRFCVVQILPDCNGILSLLVKRKSNSGSSNQSCRYQFAIQIKDASGTELVALVVGEPGKDLFGCDAREADALDQADGLALLANLTRGTTECKGSIQCKLVDGERYFFIKSIERLGVFV